MEQTALNTLPPLLQSPEAPVLVKLVTPLNVAPLKLSAGLELLTAPRKVLEGPNTRAAVPLRAKFSDVASDWANWRSNNCPAETPPEPMEILSPVASVAVAVVL